MTQGHISVLLHEAVELLAPVDGGLYVDGNLGLGGHSRVILERTSPGGRVIGFDLDEAALSQAQVNLADFGDRLLCLHRNFAELKPALKELGISQVDGILLDLGLSSLQLDAVGRGFSFQKDEPLDMRMDVRQQTTAASLVNSLSEQDLADIFYYYGEERQARRIASFVVLERRNAPIETTRQLADLVCRAVPKRFQPKRIHAATLVFQSLRIAVNRELESLRQILDDGVALLAPGGIFCVISFHSLEDRMVKQSFRDHPKLKVLTKKPVVPGPDEVATNPRARSAKLRGAKKEKR